MTEVEDSSDYAARWMRFDSCGRTFYELQYIRYGTLHVEWYNGKKDLIHHREIRSEEEQADYCSPLCPECLAGDPDATFTYIAGPWNCARCSAGDESRLKYEDAGKTIREFHVNGKFTGWSVSTEGSPEESDNYVKKITGSAELGSFNSETFMQYDRNGEFDLKYIRYQAMDGRIWVYYDGNGCISGALRVILRPYNEIYTDKNGDVMSKYRTFDFGFKNSHATEKKYFLKSGGMAIETDIYEKDRKRHRTTRLGKDGSLLSMKTEVAKISPERTKVNGDIRNKLGKIVSRKEFFKQLHAKQKDIGDIVQDYRLKFPNKERWD